MMLTLLLGAFLLLLVLSSVSLMKTYQHIPISELRRRARGYDEYSRLLYQLRSYGPGLDMILWTITGIASAALFIILARGLSVWISLVLVLLIIWAAFAWIPTGRVTKWGRRIAKIMAPLLLKLVSLLVPVSDRLSRLIRRVRPVTFHTGLYEPEDFINLLDAQARQTDNRISPIELRVIKGALSFGQKPIREVMTPRRMLKIVSADDPISPHTMDQLHASGFSRFPVIKTTEESGEQFVGTLYLKDLVNHRAGGTIGEVMKPEVYYVNEEKTLSQVIDAFLKTKHHLFIVVNNFEETVGIVTIEDVLEEIIGHEIIDEFDRYDDLRAVAADQAEQQRAEIPEKIV